MQVDIKAYDPDKLAGDDRLRMEGFDSAVSRAIDVLPNLSLETGIATMDLVLSDVRNLLGTELADQLSAARVHYACELMEANPTAYGMEAQND